MMELFPVIISAAGIFILGAIWYSPHFLGTMWMEDANVPNTKPNKIPLRLSFGFMNALLQAFALWTILILLDIRNLQTAGILIGILWLGFYVPVTLTPILWEHKPLRLFLINAGYYLFSLLIAGGILTAFL